MNRIVFGGIAVIVTAILAWTIFVSFFATTDPARAEAFVVITPLTDRGATLFGDITKTAQALAQTDVFRAAFINDLALSGIAFDQNDLRATAIVQRAPGLLGIEVHGDDAAQTPRIATSAAYSLVRTIERYYGTKNAALMFTVIDGAVVAPTPQLSPLLGAVLSVALSVLIVALIFALVFAFLRQKRQERPYGTIHASHARLDLKLPQKNTATQRTDSDYMHNVYNEYDASLEKLVTTEPEAASLDDDVTATKDIQERIKEVSEEIPEISPPLSQTKDVQTLPTQKSVQDTAATTTASEKATKVLHTLSALIKEKQQEVRTAIKNNTTKTALKSMSKKGSTSETSTPPRVATHAAPPNLPVMRASAKEHNDAPLLQSTGTAVADNTKQSTPNATQGKTASTDDPTPDEIRRRLNELLKGRPPSSLED